MKHEHDKERRFCHPLPNLRPSSAKKYAKSSSLVRPGFHVEDEHAIVLCEMGIENRAYTPELLSIITPLLERA